MIKLKEYPAGQHCPDTLLSVHDLQILSGPVLSHILEHAGRGVGEGVGEGVGATVVVITNDAWVVVVVAMNAVVVEVVEVVVVVGAVVVPAAFKDGVVKKSM